MSYWIETEKGEVENYDTDSYAIECSYCCNNIEYIRRINESNNN